MLLLRAPTLEIIPSITIMFCGFGKHYSVFEQALEKLCSNHSDIRK